jgi:nucleoside-diphosphate-sugar epimerase
MRNILVTGGAGFIETYLSPALREAFPDAAVTVAAHPAQPDWAAQLAGRAFDGVVHAAALDDPAPDPAALEGAFQPLLAFAEPALTPVVYLSSSAVYGARPGVRREADSVAPADSQAAALGRLEAAAQRAAAARPAWRLVGLRVFPVYGGAGGGLVHRLYAGMKAGHAPRVPPPGTQKFDLVYAPDVAAMVVAGLRARRGGVFNCGSGQGISPLELVGLLNRELGTEHAPEAAGDGDGFPAALVADMKKARYELGFEPKWTPAAGIADYVARLEAGD